MGRYTGKKCRLIGMLSLTGSYFLVEIIVGYLTNSTALIADSFHMLSDVIALVIAFLSIKMSPKQWSKNTFGWARSEVLGALVNAVFLIALCFSIFVEALKRFFEPEEIFDPVLILYVGGFGLLVNIIGLFLFHEHGHSHSGHNDDKKHTKSSSKEHLKENGTPGNEAIFSIDINTPAVDGAQKPKKKLDSSSQMNMKGVFLHVLTDALGSVIVIISALIIWLTSWEYRFYVDPALSVIMVCLIMASTCPLLADSARILLQTVPTHIQVDNLKKKLLQKVDGVLAVHEFHIWQLTGERIIASAHILCRNTHEYMEIAGKVKEFFHEQGIHSTTIQAEFIESEYIHQDCILNCPTENNCKSQTCCGPRNLKEKNVTSNKADTTNLLMPPISDNEHTSDIAIDEGNGSFDTELTAGCYGNFKKIADAE
ncbi:proton-coupled zinc antiporter SLC30A1-like isoform X1 [Tachypleus tridentatus]|uniref:proton-coupled zinc antiporter SLC30A1-like isoform X1 n=2 Tax=Tachypleus tridentatus TaxID=6853 RepID=UPI003FD2C410